jgi:hypothetical protein
MTKRAQSALITFLAVSLSGCVATVGAEKLSVPRDSAQQCARHCAAIGMSLGAVAIMAENVGCICKPAQTESGGGEAAGITAGMATIAMQVQQRQQQQQPTAAAPRR